MATPNIEDIFDNACETQCWDYDSQINVLLQFLIDCPELAPAFETYIAGRIDAENNP